MDRNKKIFQKSFGITDLPILSIKDKHISLVFGAIVTLAVINILQGIYSVLVDDTLRAPESFLDG